MIVGLALKENKMSCSAREGRRVDASSTQRKRLTPHVLGHGIPHPYHRLKMHLVFARGF